MAAQDPGRERFGADTHRYEVTPTLAEAEIRAFEESHGVDLPMEYRSFVAEVGNGPAGPCHGLMPLTVTRPEAGDPDAVRIRAYDLRSSAQEALFRVQMLTDDDRLSGTAEDVLADITELPKADARAALDELRARTRDDISRLVGSAKQHL